MQSKFLLLILISAVTMCAQTTSDSQAVMLQILQRLDSLEEQNRELIKQVQALKAEIKATSKAENTTAEATPPTQKSQEVTNDRLTLDEHRIEEQAQTKVEASQKFPVRLNGMLLFNAFANSGSSATEAASYNLVSGPATTGATLRQTLLGLEFQGPSLPGGGHVNGSLMMDFWAGSAEPGNNWLRLRRADLSFDWANRSFTVGQDKPLISPYAPDSLAEVGIPPLAGAGNLWLWLPQARYEERVHFGQNTGLTGQVALMQTDESYETVPIQFSSSLQLARPAVEGRLAFWHKFDDVRRIEVAPGFHVSSTHVAGSSVGSQIASLDWHIVPFSKLDLTGTVYKGQNVAGLGALGNGFTILGNGAARPVDSSGGWSQLSFPITSRITINLFGGIEGDHASYASSYDTVRNVTYASNLLYHLGPNVVIGLEGLQMRTRSFSGIHEIHNHYDLALGYLF